MSKIYTKTGDDGTTGLLGPGRYPKDDPRIDAYGTVDELNAALGVARTHTSHSEFDPILARIQDDLFVVGSALADPDPSGAFFGAIRDNQVERLELWIDDLNARLPSLTQFILPGGAPGAAYLHLSRTICRRAERLVVHLGHLPDHAVAPAVSVYLNRLSDLLFVLARALNHEANVPDVPWQGL